MTIHDWSISDIDECDVGSSRCDVNATCVNNAGYYDCECDDGFYGDGFTCRGRL